MNKQLTKDVATLLIYMVLCILGLFAIDYLDRQIAVDQEQLEFNTELKPFYFNDEIDPEDDGDGVIE